MLRYTLFLTSLFLILIVFIGCTGGGKNPIMLNGEPNDSQSAKIPDIADIDPYALGGRQIVAVYDVTIDPDSQTFSITPAANRSSEYHFPLSHYYPNVITITGVGFYPHLWADIKLTHPYPGSGIEGYDARVIAILPAISGKSFSYPTFSAVGNNKVVLEPDGYTKLHDALGGGIAGNTNPFKAYFKSQPYRVWSSTGMTSETQRWNLNLDGFGGPIQYKLVVDVSTNYPTASQPLIDNAPEAVQISANISSGLTSFGGIASVNVTTLDWMDADNSVCGIEAPSLFFGKVDLRSRGPGAEPYTWLFEGEIRNTKFASPGVYPALIGCTTIPENTYMYKEVTVVVTSGLFPLTWGGSWDDFANDVACDNQGYIYCLGHFDGTADFDPGYGMFIQTSLGSNDVYLSKFDPNGQLVWVRFVQSSANEISGGIIIDKTNNIYICLSPDQNGSAKKYNSNGDLLNEANWPADWYSAFFSPKQIICDDNFIYFAGEFGGNVDFDPSGNEDWHESNARDVFVVKMSKDLSIYEWGRHYLNEKDDQLDRIELNNNNMIFLVGYLGYDWYNDWDTEAFIFKYDHDGNLVSNLQWGGSDWCESRALIFDSNNNLYVTGEFSLSVNFNPNITPPAPGTSLGGRDVFFSKFDPSLNFLWVKTWGGVEDDRGIEIKIDSINRLQIFGIFRNLVDFDPSPGYIDNGQSIGGSDFFINRFTLNGAYIGKTVWGDPDDEQFSSVTFTPPYFYIVGHFYGLDDFDPGPEIVWRWPSGGCDAYLTRIDTMGNLVP